MSFGLAPGSYTQHQHSDHLPQEPAYVPFTLSSLSASASAILGPTDPSNNPQLNTSASAPNYMSPNDPLQQDDPWKPRLSPVQTTTTTGNAEPADSWDRWRGSFLQAPRSPDRSSRLIPDLVGTPVPASYGPSDCQFGIPCSDSHAFDSWQSGHFMMNSIPIDSQMPIFPTAKHATTSSTFVRWTLSIAQSCSSICNSCISVWHEHEWFVEC